MSGIDFLLSPLRRMGHDVWLLVIVGGTIFGLAMLVGIMVRGKVKAPRLNTACMAVYAFVILAAPILLLVAEGWRARDAIGGLAVLFLFFAAMQMFAMGNRFRVSPRDALALTFAPWVFGLVEHFLFGGTWRGLGAMAFDVAIFAGFTTYNAFWLVFPFLIMGPHPIRNEKSPFHDPAKTPVRALLGVLIVLLLVLAGYTMLAAVWPTYLMFAFLDGGTPLAYLLAVIAVQVGLEFLALRRAAALHAE